MKRSYSLMPSNLSRFNSTLALLILGWFLQIPSAHAERAITTPGSIYEQIKEADSKFQCNGNEIMTGRHHGGDENKKTLYFCRHGLQQGQEVKIKDKVLSEGFSEWDGVWYKCPEGKVMTGREHDEDENGETRYWCGTPYIEDLGPMSIIPENQWRHVAAEEATYFHCDQEGGLGIYVIVGRYHYGDEKEPTKYLCATLW